MIELSPSSLSNYYDCPFAFYLSKIKKIRLGDDNYTLFGKSVHKVLEHIWDFGTDKIALEKSIEKYWDPNVPSEMEDAANLCFENFLSKSLEPPLFVEKELHSKKLGTVCHVDVIRPIKIEDYKTSKAFTIKPKPREVLQGIINILSVEECLGIPMEEADFLYLKINKTKIIKPEERYISFVEEFIGKVIDSINDNEFPKTGKCNSCYYNIICKTQEKFIQKTLCTQEK